MKTIGLKSIDFFHMMFGNNLKRDLLYFDEILIDQDHFQDCADMVKMDPSVGNGVLLYNLNEIEYLEKKGLVKIEKIPEFFKKYIPLEDLGLIDIERDYVIQNKKKVKTQKEIQEELLRKMILDNFESNMNARKICSSLNENEIYNIKPILEIRAEMDRDLIPFQELSKQYFAKNEDVLNLVLHKIPLPNTQVSWEELMEFRNNEELNIYKLGLVNWITDITKSDYNLYEIEQKLEYQLAQYEERLKKEKLRYQIETTELLISTPILVLENIIKLQWSQLAKSFFDLRRKKVDLMMGETKAPGRELAYISKIKNKFDK